MLGGVATGLAMKLIVSFETAVVSEFHDSMRVISDENYSNVVKIHAFPPQSQITFEPFINFGFVKVNMEKEEFVSFKNEGKVEGKVELRHDDFPDISIEQSVFYIKPNQVKYAKITYRLIKSFN